jgi:hypothetical protein
MRLPATDGRATLLLTTQQQLMDMDGSKVFRHHLFVEMRNAGFGIEGTRFSYVMKTR